MASWDGKSQTGLLGYKIFVAILRYGGLWPAYFILSFVALYYFLFSTGSSRHILTYFKERLGFSKLKSLTSLYRNYYVFGQTLIDRVSVIAGLSAKFSYDFDGEEHLHKIVQDNRGGILISAHMGNWEIAGHLLYRVKAKINVLMHVAEHEKIKSYLDKVKGGSRMNVIVMRDDYTHIYEISEALSRGELICMHGDRFMPWSKTLKTPFLGEEAHFPQGPFAIAVSMKVPVCYVFAMKEGFTHYHFSPTPPVTYTSKEKNKNELIQEALNNSALIMENTIKKYPLQWFNYYNFWNTPRT